LSAAAGANIGYAVFPEKNPAVESVWISCVSPELERPTALDDPTELDNAEAE
jgi:hypothetical protein